MGTGPQEVAPLAAAMVAAGLSASKLAETLKVSPAGISRWAHGSRTPSPRVYFVLGTALGAADLRERHERWLREHRPQKPPKPALTIELALPEDMDAERARQVCVAALAQVLTSPEGRP